MSHSNNLTGQTIGRYQILERLGQGGMAEVYKAYQPSLDRYVAIKVMHAFLAREEGFLARFQREAKNVAALQHPNIIQVFDFDVHDAMPYMVMEFVEGQTLKGHLEDLDRQGSTPSFHEAVHFVTEVGRALDYAHQSGMIHRDVKPANVLLSTKHRVILTDFGIAKILTSPSLTATGAMLGTPAYMSPEQSLGQPGDHRSDLYSLSVMLYQLGTGQLPYDADTPLAVMLKHVNDPLPLPRSVRPELPEALERIILKGLAKNPADRFQSAAEMLQALAQTASAVPTAARSAVRPAQVTTERVSPVTAPVISLHPSGAGRAGQRLLPLAGLVVALVLCGTLVLAAYALRTSLGSVFPPVATAAATAVAQVVTAPPPGGTTPAPATPLPETNTPPPSPSPRPSLASPPAAQHKLCGLSTVGGFQAGPFSQSTYAGLLMVETKLGWAVATAEPQQSDDLFPNLAAFVNANCDLIVAVGFESEAAVTSVAAAHPEQRLVLLDHTLVAEFANVWQETYAVDQAAFLAGYAAAAASQTGVVGTFGGLNVSPVRDFMDGFSLGVAYYNQKHNTSVQVLGWDPARPEDGLFLGGFDSHAAGYAATANLIDQGADVVMPVAGQAGLGAANAALDHRDILVVGVDSDWAVSMPEYGSVVLTSVIKQLGASVLSAAQAVLDGSFQGGVHQGTLANGGVGLAPFYDQEARLPAAVLDELAALAVEISAGRLPTRP